MKTFEEVREKVSKTIGRLNLYGYQHDGSELTIMLNQLKIRYNNGKVTHQDISDLENYADKLETKMNGNKNVKIPSSDIAGPSSSSSSQKHIPLQRGHGVEILKMVKKDEVEAEKRRRILAEAAEKRKQEQEQRIEAEFNRVMNENKQRAEEQRKRKIEQMENNRLMFEYQQEVEEQERQRIHHLRIDDTIKFNRLLNPQYIQRSEQSRFKNIYPRLITYLNQIVADNTRNGRLIIKSQCEEVLDCTPFNVNSISQRNKRCYCCYICNKIITPGQNDKNSLDAGYECDHIIPFFSGAAFLGHDIREEFAWVHNRCNNVKSRNQNDNNDLWGWDILRRPYRDQYGHIQLWSLNEGGIKKLRDEVEKQRKNVEYFKLDDNCDNSEVYTELLNKLNQGGNAEKILKRYIDGLYYLALIRSFNPDNPGNNKPPEQNENYITCLNYANGEMSRQNHFGNKKENDAFLKLVSTPPQFNKFGKDAGYIAGELIKKLKKPRSGKNYPLSPKSPLEKHQPSSSSETSDSFSFGKRKISLKMLKLDLIRLNKCSFKVKHGF